ARAVPRTLLERGPQRREVGPAAARVPYLETPGLGGLQQRLQPAPADAVPGHAPAFRERVAQDDHATHAGRLGGGPLAVAEAERVVAELDRERRELGDRVDPRQALSGVGGRE